MKLKYVSRTHAYYLNGKRCRGASTVAKVPDDPYALMQWKPRMALLGAAMQPTILTEVAANHDDKDKLDALVEKAIEHGKGTTGRDYGVAAHEIIRRHSEGDVLLETPMVKRLRQQWVELLDAHGLEVIATEGAVVHPELMMCGRFDGVIGERGTRRAYTGDIKTGQAADKYLHAHAVQLHVYASAPLMASGIPSGDVDFETEEFVPMYEVDQSVGFVFHLPMDGEPKLVPVDIAAGGECFRSIVVPTLAWRARKDLRVDWSPAPAAPTRPDPHHHAKTLGGAVPAVTVPVAPDEGAAVGKDDHEVEQLRGRYIALDPAAKAWVDELRAQALVAGCDFHLAGNYTARRLAIMDGLTALAAAGKDDDDLVRAIVRFAIDDDVVEWMSTPAGAAVGLCDHAQAALFVATARLAAQGLIEHDLTLDGPRLRELAA